MTTDYGLVYDMRAPAFGAPATELYRAAIEQCAWADQHGFSRVTFPEHHASDDGYLPSPIVMAAAVAGVTQQMLIHLSVVLLPLYHPLRAAEDLAVLDLVSGGRLPRRGVRAVRSRHPQAAVADGASRGRAQGRVDG